MEPRINGGLYHIPCDGTVEIVTRLKEMLPSTGFSFLMADRGNV